jgi:hypothetical protein
MVAISSRILAAVTKRAAREERELQRAMAPLKVKPKKKATTSG